MSDKVEHPQHYCTGEIECIDAIQAMMTFEEFEAFCRGQATKYCWRAGKKESAIEDLKKALWYLERAIRERECE